MKPRRREFEIFSLSFLDVISCGFGAVALLVLISQFSISDETGGADDPAVLLREVVEADGRVETLKSELARGTASLAAIRAELRRRLEETAGVERALAAAAGEREAVLGRVEDLRAVRRATDTRRRKADDIGRRDDEVGGIPVDRDHVVFVVDTSGSMQTIWPRVTREIENVVRIHPRLKGFQILNDNGVPLMAGYRNRWIPDTRTTREHVLRQFRTWAIASNSSPVEGLELALRRYVRGTPSVSIYIFGDDYTGSSYDPVLRTLDALNADPATGAPRARVHAIGFVSPRTLGRFEILMREVARRNDGTFIALPAAFSPQPAGGASYPRRTEP